MADSSQHDAFILPQRPRRLRKNPAIRDLVRENFLRPTDFVLPLFVVDGDAAPEEIASMPGQFRRSITDTAQFCSELTQRGLRGVALFPKLDRSLKTERGDEALNRDTLILRAARAVKAAAPGLQLFTDIALDPYTTHGHDGVLTEDGSDVDNDSSLEVLAQMALLHAEAGVDFVAPSDMMDGRVGVIRDALEDSGYSSVGIIAYTAKYASAYYGPFRDAVGSAQAAGTHLLSKHTYQMDPANRREAINELELDEAEGADIVMVKPAGSYLDIIRDLREHTQLPVAAYQVSGEYSQIHAAAHQGWLSLEETRDEALIAIKRAGADIIFSYFAEQYLQE